MAASPTRVFSVSDAGTSPDRGERSIGAILIAAGRLDPERAERILRVQRERGLRFGDAATQLGLLTKEDIEFALSRQFDHPYLLAGESKVSEELVTAYVPSEPLGEALRGLRSRLTQGWFDTDPEHNALAIVSAERKEGRSFIAANLAVVFSQLGARTLLIDADMRNPRQHELFGLDNRHGLSGMLGGLAGPEAVQCIAGMRTLSVLPAGARPPNPLDLLARPLFSSLLQQLKREWDVTLIDCPAACDCADSHAIAVRAGAALIVVRKNASRMWRVRGVSETVAQASTVVLGAVLNDF